MIIWHYTNATGMGHIFDCGLIKASTINVPSHEKPVVWLSANQGWERTAAQIQLDLSDGSIIAIPTPDGQAAMGLGLYRLGLPAARLMKYPECRKALNINQRRLRTLNHDARKVGANPADWYVHEGEILIDDADLVFSYRSEKSWKEAPISEASNILHRCLDEYEPVYAELASGNVPAWLKRAA